MRELDVLLTAWLEASYASADSGRRAAFDRLLDCEDDAIWDWMMGRAQPPDDLLDIVGLIGQHHAEQRRPR
jgi:antitoxin CptB